MLQEKGRSKVGEKIRICFVVFFKTHLPIPTYSFSPWATEKH